MPTITGLYSMQEAAQHSTKGDCWVVIDGKVYDVSSYLDDHPGGDDVIIASTGKNATDDFEDAGHSKEARDLMETFWIGEIGTSSTSLKEQVTVNSQKFMKLAKQYWAVPTAIVGISVVVSFLYLRKK